MTTGEMPKPTTTTEPNPAAALQQSPKQVGLRLHRPPLLTNISAARWLLLAIVAASIYFFHGFLVPVLAAMVIALASWPLRERAAHQLNLGRTGAATLLVLVLVCFLLIPIAMALIYAFRELRDWINWAIVVNSSGAPTPGWMVELPQVGDWLDENWQTYVGRPGGISEIVQLVSGSNIGAIYRGAVTAGTLAFHLALTLLFMLITLFVLYRDGDRIVAQIDQVGRRILPDRWSRLSRVVPATISSTVTGMTLIAIGEGVILGIAYWLAGVPSPVTFGVITGFMALIPGGAPLSFTLVSAYLVASGTPFAGAALFIWGTCELFVVDKTIRPVLVGGPVKLPFLPTFFGLIGGVKTMGIVGLFVGPVLMALLVSIWREWQRELSEEEQRQDSKLIGLE
ncbi:AI-2E family transporter [Paracoccus versutus]|uniref:PurR-regulated permease PerM n=1 Tax=Paracoccus versutus TaxID=34007 RepID=A0AAQ0KK13_PARVE|nr:AI-2E family transporter [Paracoccus versutus]WGR59629.1 AI-2E family transporter [Paracoccus ferrooxidans]KGJ07859.1 ABC transporter permease [Paracoccus versutus]RDD72258.1 AI-2E family transporter [Paracoccus versutus]REG36515.1 putative PurR-regulated permease PerM [Paracoccus versutus]WEJ79463.1 AI-2E family transporter [Paracoccus versutus]